MKRVLLLITAIILAVTAFGASACSSKENEDIEELISETDFIEIDDSYAPKKDGYRFCGYFIDEDLTRRVKDPVKEKVSSYYPKYQPDITETSKDIPYKLDQVVYASSYNDALNKYKYMSNLSNIAKNMVYSAVGNTGFFGDSVSNIDIMLAEENKDINDFLSYNDCFSYKVATTGETGVIQKTYTRDIDWTTYIGNVSTQDGIKYYVVKNKYAVIVGFDSQAKIQGEYTFPEKLGNKTVKEISIFLSPQDVFDVSVLTVPKTVDNFVFIDGSFNSKNNVTKVVFSEGVKTVQLFGGKFEEIFIPSTAYYVNLSQYYVFGSNYPASLYIPDQKITVNGGSHYFTENGCLYSREGDLVYQFANKDGVELKIKEGTKRVLRRSVTGKNKNVYIPESVEYFDSLFSEFSPRFNVMRGANNNVQYVFVTDNVDFIEFCLMPINGILVDDLSALPPDYLNVHLMLYKGCVLFSDIPKESIKAIEDDIISKMLQFGKVTQQKVDEIYDETISALYYYFEKKIFKIEDGVVYYHKTDYIFGGMEEAWSVLTYFTDEFKGEITEQMLCDADRVFSLYKQTSVD